MNIKLLIIELSYMYNESIESNFRIDTYLMFSIYTFERLN